jgi:hypothetical protein
MWRQVALGKALKHARGTYYLTRKGQGSRRGKYVVPKLAWCIFGNGMTKDMSSDCGAFHSVHKQTPPGSSFITSLANDNNKRGQSTWQTVGQTASCSRSVASQAPVDHAPFISCLWLQLGREHHCLLPFPRFQRLYYSSAS